MGSHELGPQKVRPVKDHVQRSDDLSSDSNTVIAYTDVEVRIPPVLLSMSSSASLGSTSSQMYRQRRRKQRIPLLTFGFVLPSGPASRKRHGLPKRSFPNRMKSATHSNYFAWILLCLAATICSFTAVVTERSRLLLRQWRVEQSHPLSIQQQNRRRNLRSQVTFSSPSSLFSHPLNSSFTKNEHRTGAKLRYLSFGSSVTWGPEVGGFLGPSDAQRSEISYPFLLDSDVYSVALPSSLEYADFAAACTQSLLDGSPSVKRSRRSNTPPPDVITVEYTSVDILQSHQILIQRLRRRYPVAMIVLVQVLNPMTHLILQEERMDYDTDTVDAQQLTFLDWKEAFDHRQSNSSTEAEGSAQSVLSSEDGTWELARNMIQATLSTSPESHFQENPSSFSWTYVQPSFIRQSRVSTMLAADPLLLHYRHASTFKITRNINDVNLATQQMHSYLIQFSMDTMISKRDFPRPTPLLSPRGHEQVAIGIRSLLEGVVKQKNQFRHWLNPFMMRYRNNPPLGSWGSGDDCHLWYNTGNYNVETVGGNPTNLPLVQNDNAGFSWMTYLMNAVSSVPHKHVLEFSPSQPFPLDGTSSSTTSFDDSKNYIVVHNPFPSERLLSLTYLTDADGMSYPTTRVILNDIPSVLIQPIRDSVVDSENEFASSDDDQSVGIARTSGVGYVPPGKSIVRLVPLQMTSLPFRLLGASILAIEVQDLATVEFALEADPTATAHVRR